MGSDVSRVDGGSGERLGRSGQNRRGFLKHVCAGAMGAVGAHAAGQSAYAKEEGGASTNPAPAKLPLITIGKHTLTRLVAGANPVGGYSHSTPNLAKHMQEYFTLERTIEFARSAEKAGINTWQTNPSDKILQAFKALRDGGSGLQWIVLTSDRPFEPKFEELLPFKPIAIVHHGGVTDALFRLKKHEEVHDYVKKVHDAGLMAGVSSHSPENIAYIEEHGWENEFFMTCFYNVLRPGKEIRDKLGTVPLGEPFLESDPVEMTNVVQQVKRPCLGFKILAAGRLCWTPQSVESAFAFALKRIKKTDGIIVGMYPKFSDELSANINLTTKYGALA